MGTTGWGDRLLLEHRARSRRGFAMGAVMAAEWISGRSGVNSFDEVLAKRLRAGSR